MALFLDIVLSFPTIVFSVALALSCLYWVMVVLGGLDVEFLDAGDGLVDGVLDAVDGGLDGALEGAEGAAEAGLDASADAAAGFSPLVALAEVFRLGKVPLTVTFSVLSLWSWLIGFGLTWLYLQGYAPVPHVVFSVGTLVGSLAAATVLTNGSIRPLEPIFHLHGARLRKSMIGEVCEISTGRVDENFGQAVARVGGDDLLFPVRCDEPNRMRRGDTALIVSFDNAREAYVVEPMAAVPATEDSASRLAPLANPALVNKEI